MSNFSVNGIDWHFIESGSVEKVPLLMLHGFTGSCKSWNHVRERLNDNFRVICLDLPGHGGTPLPDEPLSLPSLAAAIREFIHELDPYPALLCGYSMGGRIAMHLLLDSPSAWLGAIMIGASPGIEDTTERRKRLESDRALAKKIRERGVPWFVDYWESLPIFASQRELSREVRDAIREQRLSNSEEGLSYALENWSPGAQDYLPAQLNGIQMPLCLIAGSQDEKYLKLNQELHSAFRDSHVLNIEIPDAGHAVHLEQPQATAEVIIKFTKHFRIDS